MKKLIFFLATLMVVSSISFEVLSVQAQAETIHQNKNNKTTETTSENLNSETISKANPYIVIENNRFVIKNQAELIKVVGTKNFKAIKQAIKTQNNSLNQVTEKEFNETATINNNVITFNNKSNSEIQTKTIPTMSAGITAIRGYWWGYRAYLNDNLTRTTAQALAGGAGVSTLVAIWSPWFSAPTAIVKALAASATLVLGGSSALLYNNNNGSGVYFRFTGRPPVTPIFTGVFPQ